MCTNVTFGHLKFVQQMGDFKMRDMWDDVNSFSIIVCQ